MTTTEILTGIKNWVLGKLILKQDVISDLATIRSGAQAGTTAVQPSDLSEYFNDASYDTSTHRINFYHGQNIVAYVDASPFIVDGMVDDVRIENGYLVIDFNTASGKQDISIPLTDIFDPSNYYNKTQTDALLGNKVDKVSGKGLSTNDYSNAEKEKLSGLQNYDDTQVRQLITQTNANFANYYTKAESYSATEVDEALGGKQNTINDLANIRSGASAGATAVQPSVMNTALVNTVAESGVYDVTANNDNAKFASLSALLSSENLNTLIPSAKRKGGMSIKFVLSSDNKYVQYRLMSDTFNTTVANWQGVDDEPTAGSQNFVKSGGVFKSLEDKTITIKKMATSWGTGWSVGEYFYNTNTNKLFRCTIVDAQGGVDGFVEVDKSQSCIYVYNENIYFYNGTTLIKKTYVLSASQNNTTKETSVIIDNNTYRVPSVNFESQSLTVEQQNNAKVNEASLIHLSHIGLLDTYAAVAGDLIWHPMFRLSKVTGTSGDYDISQITTDYSNATFEYKGDLYRIINNSLYRISNEIERYYLHSGDLVQGSYNSAGYLDSNAKSVASYTYFKIPLSRKIELSSTYPFLGFRVALYDGNGNFLSITGNFNTSIFDLTSLSADNVYYRVCARGSVNVTPQEVSEIVTTGNRISEIDDFMNSDLTDALSENDYTYSKYGYFNQDKEFVESGQSIMTRFYDNSDGSIKKIIAWLRGYSGNAHILFFNSYDFSAETCIGSFGIDDEISRVEASVPSECVVIAAVNVEQIYHTPKIYILKERFTTKISEIDIIKNKGVTNVYNTEAVRVTEEAFDYDCDFRMLVFADPHSLEGYKYSKYKDIQSKGKIDIILGLGDVNPYYTVERQELKQKMSDMLTLSGRNPDCVYVVGNHEFMVNLDYMWQRGEFATIQPVISNEYVYTKKEMFDITTKQISNRAVFDKNDPYGCYYYIDYIPQKIRLIVLNSSDIYEPNGSLEYKYEEFMMFQQRQVSWYADALDLSDKDDMSQWSVMVALHHHYQFGFITELLAAVKNGNAINKSWTLQRRYLYDDAAHKYTSTIMDSPVTISVNKDYTGKNVTVIGVFHGHSHQDVDRVSNGINCYEFICDNGTLNHMYKAPVSGLSSGVYFFQTKNGNKFEFEVTENLPNAVYIGYNLYLQTASEEILIYDEIGEVIYFCNGTRVESSSGTEITGFVDSETSIISKEKCSIVCINKVNRSVKTFPYGSAIPRLVNY